MNKKAVTTSLAPASVGAYSQAILAGDTAYLSGQIPLVPATGELVDGDMEVQIRQVFTNLQAVAQAAGGGLEDIVKLTVFLLDMEQFGLVNRVMEELFAKPYPARAVVGVSALPKGARVEIDAVMVCDQTD